MAGPLIEMLQGLRQRRMRRRSGWGGGDTPGMRDIINPLDSQAMADRAQGVDISSSMPGTRLETRFSQPMEESFVTAELAGGSPAGASLPQPAASSTVAAPEAAPQMEERSPFMTAAGSNARAQPVSGSQYPQQRQYFNQPPVCTGPNCGQGGGTVINERVTHINGVPVGGAQPGTPTQAAPATAAPTTVPPTDPFVQFQENYKQFATDPKNANWMMVAKSAVDQANGYFKLSQAATTTAEKQYYRKLANTWGMEAANAMKASIMQADAQKRQGLVERQLNRNTIGGQTAEMVEFLTQSNPEYGPDDRAALYVGRLRQLTGQPAYETDQQMQADPQYIKARGMAHAGEIATLAANNFASREDHLPFGTQQERAIDNEAAWSRAVGYYGAMPFEQASAEIRTRFVPAYTRVLTDLNASRPQDARITPDVIQSNAQATGKYLEALVYHDQNPEWAQPSQPAAPPQGASPPAAATGTTMPTLTLSGASPNVITSGSSR